MISSESFVQLLFRATEKVAKRSRAFFTLKGYNVLAQKKLRKKMLYHMVASRSLALLLCSIFRYK